MGQTYSTQAFSDIVSTIQSFYGFFNFIVFWHQPSLFIISFLGRDFFCLKTTKTFIIIRFVKAGVSDSFFDEEVY